MRKTLRLLGLSLALLLFGCNDRQGAGGTCATNRDCGSGEACISGTCTPAAAKGCTMDLECDVGQVCDPSTSSCMTPQIVTCMTDDVCPAHQRCNPLTGVCVDGRRACTMAGDCSSGLHCDVGAQQCVECLENAHCGADATCQAGSCMPIGMPPPGGCTADPHCNPPDQICMSGTCTLGCAQPGGLTCSNGDVCDNTTGRCVSIRGPCNGDGECAPPLEVCEFGQCIPGCTEFGGVQCPGGQQCNPSTGRCTMVGNICLSDLDCARPSEVCNLTTGACDPGCGTAGCPGTDTCDAATGHCVGTRTCMPDRLEPNETFATASPGGGTQVGLTLCAGDVDFYSATVGGGDDITVTLDSVFGEGNIDIDLVDEAGSVVASAATTNNQEVIQYTSPSGGNYGVRVFLAQDLGPTPGTQYSIDIDATVAPCQEDNFEDNDSPFLAPFISPGTTSLSICPSDDDYFQVFLDAGEEMTVTALFSQAEGDIDMAILGFFGIPIDTAVSSTDNETLTYVATEADFVTIQLTLFQDAGSVAGNPYDLQIVVTQAPPQTCPVDSFEENDTLGAASNLTLGTHNNLNACEQDDDFYAITLAANDVVTIDATFSDAEGDLDVELQDSAGTVLASGRTNTDDESFTHTVTAAGTYYVRVTMYGDAGSTLGNTYGLSVSTSGGPPPPPVCSDTFEPNDSMAAASSITMGNYANLNSCDTDDDFYSISLTAGQTINIDALFVDAEGDIDMELFDPMGGSIVTADTSSDNENIAGTINISGVFTLRVYLYADAGTNPGNSYTLNLTP